MSQFLDKLPAHLDIHIRPMVMDDLDAVYDIDQVSFSLPWPRSAFRYELLENPKSLLYVAEALIPGGNHLVVGAIVVWMIVDEAHIATLAVHPDYRGHGIGGKLLEVALRVALQHGAQAATLEVRANNLSAQSLYKRFKFETVGRRPRYYRDNNEDALIMTVEPLNQAYLDWLNHRQG